MSFQSKFLDTISSNWNQTDKPLQTKFLLTVAISAVFLAKTVKFFVASWKNNLLLEKAKQKRTQRDLMIHKELESLPKVSEELTNLVLNSKVVELAELLNEDKVTSEQILVIYHRRAIVQGLRLELIAESNFTEALELARECDRVRKNTPKEERQKLGVLYGIPVSIKDSIEQKGLDSTCGRASRCFLPCKEDGTVVTLLKAQGAIPFIRSSTPQILRVFDCRNHIWGVGVNPWNFSRSVGGSSGGDAGLIAARCSPLTFGSDAYGSIRIPSAFAGVYGIKPTSGRYSPAGHTPLCLYDIIKFSFVIQSTEGPIGRCTDDLMHLIKGLITREGRIADPTIPYVPWSEEKYLSKESLKIGYVVSEELFEASEPSQRAVREAVQALKKRGHQVVEIKIPQFEEICWNIVRLLFLEGDARSNKAALEGEKPIESVSFLMKLGEMPNMIKRILKVFSKPRTGKLLEHSMELPGNEMILALSKLIEMRGSFTQWWASMKFDAIITPPNALPAYKHNYGGKLVLAACYLWIASLCNLPSGIVPVTKVREDETKYNDAKSKYHNDMLSKYSEECMEGSAGLPVGVQVLTLPWADEKCLRVMKEIEDEIKFYELPDFEKTQAYLRRLGQASV